MQVVERAAGPLKRIADHGQEVALGVAERQRIGGLAAIFAGVMGMGSGLLTVVHTTIWARYYGRAHLGKIRGSLSTITVGASSLGPFAMGFAYDLTGGYTGILWVFAAMVAPMALVGLLATPPQQKAATA